MKKILLLTQSQGFLALESYTKRNFLTRIFIIQLLLTVPKIIGMYVKLNKKYQSSQKKKINFTFNPHLLPTYRGILTSIYISLKKKSSAIKLRNELINFYKKSPFIKVLKLNSPLGSGNVLNTNNCEISICETRIKNKIVIFSAIDNLIKGASGQAIQNMNILFNYKENLGLK